MIYYIRKEGAGDISQHTDYLKPSNHFWGCGCRQYEGISRISKKKGKINCGSCKGIIDGKI